MQERIAPDFDRQLITELGLLDVSAVAYGGLKEERFEIAPPLELRRMLQQDFQERNNGLLRVGQYNAYNSYVVGEAGTVYKVWTDNRNGLTTLYFAFSTDKGQTWSLESKIDERIGRMFNPRLAVDRDGYLYVMWRNWSNIKSNAFYFARSGDEGQTWSNRIRIDEIGGKNFGRPNLEINTDNGYLYITWENRRYTNTGIYVTHSADGGQTWSGKIRMANIGS
jgi:hypothetical protein